MFVIMIACCEICGEPVACYKDKEVHACSHCHECTIDIMADGIIFTGHCQECLATIKRMEQKSGHC